MRRNPELLPLVSLLRVLGPSSARQNRSDRWPKKRKQEARANSVVLPLMRSGTAGVDVAILGVRSGFRADRTNESVLSFPTFTQDSNALADLVPTMRHPNCGHGVRGSVLDLFPILETGGFEVRINARQVKNVPGRRRRCLR
jgi:hypothetical protein